MLHVWVVTWHPGQLFVGPPILLLLRAGLVCVTRMPGPEATSTKSMGSALLSAELLLLESLHPALIPHDTGPPHHQVKPDSRRRQTEKRRTVCSFSLPGNPCSYRLALLVQPQLLDLVGSSTGWGHAFCVFLCTKLRVTSNLPFQPF